MPEEKILTVNLSSAVKKTRVRRAAYATSLLKKDVAKRTGAKDVKLGSFLNSEIWKSGAKKPPSSVRVKAVIDEGIARVELINHEYKEFKPKSVAKREKLTDKLRAHLSPKEHQKEELEKKIEGTKEGEEPRGPAVAAEEKGAAKAEMSEKKVRQQDSMEEKAKTDTKKAE